MKTRETYFTIAVLAIVTVLVTGVWIASHSAGMEIEKFSDPPVDSMVVQDVTGDPALANVGESGLSGRTTVPDAAKGGLWGLVLNSASGEPQSGVQLLVDGALVRSDESGQVRLAAGVEGANDIQLVDPGIWILDRVSHYPGQPADSSEAPGPVFVTQVTRFRSGSFTIALLDEVTGEAIPEFGVELSAGARTEPQLAVSDDQGLVQVPERFGIHALQVRAFDGTGVEGAWTDKESNSVAPGPMGAPTELRLPVGPTYTVNLEGCTDDQRVAAAFSLGGTGVLLSGMPVVASR